jgi:hypothetical protein
MIYIPHNVTLLARGARILGCILIFDWFLVMIMIGMSNQNDFNSSSMRSMDSFISATIFYLFSGLTLILAARRVERGKFWAIVLTMSVGAICVVKAILARILYAAGIQFIEAPACMEWPAAFGGFFFLVATAMVWPDLRDLWRSSRRDSMPRRGFEVMMPPGSNKGPVPPPVRHLAPSQPGKKTSSVKHSPEPPASGN